MFCSWPSSHQVPSLTTQPDKVTETFLLPLRTVVASSSATRSSRSAQQSPPRSAALAGLALMAKPPSVIPSAAAMAMRLDVFVSPPNMSISTFPDQLPNPNSRSGLASRHHPVEFHHERRNGTPPIREFYSCLYGFLSRGKLQTGKA